MASPIISIDTQHNDMIHDSQFDYYARKLATCSSDRSIKIFEVAGEICQPSATIVEHEGPVWQVAWGHPKFGVILASCSYDASVIIHRESPQGTWKKIHTHKFHESSVNSISWAPHDYGLALACASSDGKVSILELEKEDKWIVNHFQNDTLGTNAVSWAPYSSVGSFTEDGRSVRRLVTGSCDNTVRIWRSVDGGWSEEGKISVSSPHSDWVRDVSWAPNTGMPYNIIASGSEDRTVYIWRQSDAEKTWTPTLMNQFDAPVWRVSWSVTGNVLAVSTGDHKVTLWKQSVDETWVQISALDEDTAM
eukprot:CAMPEP_0182419684 /NCGR_PEP_ID=MMETSP1167-20130531/4084_1 /TAXON_ID=2988 /ORGANISM="Mallomonas Sp, Strain CCMP3275" /LENGTH=305 /DNA_ID=CAMNT_0024594737 /DNA_START=64 /DNA_END=981 /DNA_ORIENTATION=+